MTDARSPRPPAAAPEAPSDRELAERLDPGPAERRQMLEAVHDVVERYLGSLDAHAASFVAAEPDTDALKVPGTALPLERVMEVLEKEVLRPGYHGAAPGHFAYITGGGLFASAVADYFAAATNKFPSYEVAGPGLAGMERAVIRWTADLVGLPASAGGHIASGGSLATFAAVVAARDAAGLCAADVTKAVVYLSELTHHCVHKALHLAGLGEAVQRAVATDDELRLDPRALAEAIDADRRAGLRPWLVVATAGATDTGTVDPLGPIADVAAENECWLHVDAAYGGAFLLTEQGRQLLRGIERADSVILDPHKGFFLSWGAGIVLTRDVRSLAASHVGTGIYMQDIAADSDPSLYSPADLSPELTKPFRALRLWLPLALAGTDAFRAALEEKLELARYAHRRLAEEGFAVGPEPDLSIITFRWTADLHDEQQIEAVNQGLVDALRRDGRIFISSTRIRGAYMLRLCVLSFRADREVVDLAIELLVAAARPQI